MEGMLTFDYDAEDITVSTAEYKEGMADSIDSIDGAQSIGGLLNDDFFDDFDDHIGWHSKDYEHYEDADAIDASFDINH